MKRIEGEIVIGAPRSPVRYLVAPSICAQCITACPQPIMSVELSEDIRTGWNSCIQQCYVCEERKECYSLR